MTPEEFERRVATWFEMPVEIFTGTPGEASQGAMARALHAEISKSSSAWFRALASRRVGSIGNWAIVAGFFVAKIRELANVMGAANQHPQQGAPPPGAGASQPGGFPPKPEGF